MNRLHMIQVFGVLSLVMVGWGTACEPMVRPAAAPPSAPTSFITFPAPTMTLALPSPATPTPPLAVPDVSPLPIEASFPLLDDGAIVTSHMTLATPPPALIVPAVAPDIVTLLNDVSAENLQATVQTLTQFGTRHAFSETDSATHGIGAARRWLMSEFERVGRGRIQVTAQDFTLDPALSHGHTLPQQNIIALLPGTADSPGVLVLMAHYDSRPPHLYDGQSNAPGTNDNASGVALLLEVARLMSTRTWDRTILFITFAAEELETQGSHAFVASALDQGLQIDGAINNDIVGGHVAIPSAVRVFSIWPDSSSSRQLARYLHFLNTLYFPDFEIVLENTPDRAGRYGDQREFYAAGIPAIRLTEVDENSVTCHTSADSADQLDYAYLVQMTRLNIVVLANLAQMSSPPLTPAITFLELPDVYRLTWEEGYAAAGYLLAFRQLDSLRYTLFFYMTGEQVSYVTLSGLAPQTTYAFSLAAVDAAGHLGGFSTETLLNTP